MIENEFGKVFGAGVYIEPHVGFVGLIEVGNDRIVMSQEQSVVELLEDPRFASFLDVEKIDDETFCIERGSRDFNFHAGIVAVDSCARTFVIHEPMAVTKSNFFGHSKHALAEPLRKPSCDGVTVLGAGNTARQALRQLHRRRDVVRPLTRRCSVGSIGR